MGFTIAHGHRRRGTALRASLACAGAAMTMLATANGASAAVAPTGETTTLSVVLAAPDPAGLAALAQAHGLSRGARMARLNALLPTAAQKAAVVAGLEAAGLTVSNTGPWVITARASAARVAARFGSRSRSSAAASLPTKPAALDGLVSGVFSSDNPGPKRKHASLPFGPTGAQLRTSYSSPANAAVSDLTVATIQYSGWSAGDLTSYASAIGVADPVASGRYVGIAVSPRTTTLRTPSDSDGDGEVALDQQALLSSAPGLRQRAYFAANSYSGELNTLQRIASDAMVASNKIVALSISWGMCEDNYFTNGVIDHQSLDPLVDAYNAIAAAGVTIFASSGDSAAYDCSFPGETNTTEATLKNVDTPGSFPSVVSVGGTSLDLGDTATAADDHEVVWASPGDGTSAYLGDGGGGGRSLLFSRPAYQGVLSPAPAMRSVPDISAMAAPDNNFASYWGRRGGWGAVGGTSLAAPLSAGLFGNALLSAGATTGVGSIHQVLYSAASYAGIHQTLRDVTSGDISFGRDASYPAKPGYDLSSGLGSPVWSEIVARSLQDITIDTAHVTRQLSVPISISASNPTAFANWRVLALSAASPDPGCLGSQAATSTPPSSVTLPGGDGPKVIYLAASNADPQSCVTSRAPIVLDTVAPNVAVTAALLSPTTRSVRTQWTGSDPSGSGIDHYAVTIKHSLESTPDYTTSSTTTSGITIEGVQGRTYSATVTAFDAAGNSTSQTASTDVPLDDTYLSMSGTWGRVFSTNDIGSSAAVSSAAGSSLTGKVAFKDLSLIFASGANNGRLDVYVDGVLRKTIDTYSAATHYRQRVAVLSLGAAGNHTVTLKLRRDHSASSHGITAVLDGLALHS